MILEWLFRGVATLWNWIVDNLPALPTPSWFATVTSSLDGITSHIAGLGAWFPFGLLGTVLGTFFLIMAAGWAVKITRIVVAFLPFVGGTSG